MSPWTAAWIAWLGAFVAIESAALVATKGTGTLSATIWRYLTRPTNRHPGLVWLARGALIAGMAVLTSHLVTGIP